VERLALDLGHQRLSGPDDALLVLERLGGVCVTEDVEVRLSDHAFE
jgi:hypothetical protein